MQLLHQPVALRLVDHEGEVQVIRGLGHQINLLILEQLESRPQFVQDPANVVTQQTQGSARPQNLDAAQALERGGQTIERRGVQGIGGGIQGHGDIRLRGGHQVDRESLSLEDLESIRQKTHLMPHAGTVHRHQRDALLDGYRFDLGGTVGHIRGHDRALERRRLRGEHMQWNFVLAHGQNTAWVQHLRTIAGNFLSLIVVQGAQQSGGRHGTGIGTEHAWHVGPNLEARRLQFGGEIRRGGVRSAAAQQHGLAGVVRGDESLGDHHLVECAPLYL